MKRAFAVAAGLLCLAASPPQAGKPLRVGVMPLIGTLPYYAAVDRLAFEAEGLQVETVTLNSGARILAALAGGSLDVGESDTLSVLQASAQGLDVVIVAAGAFVRTDAQAVSGLVVRAQSALREARDLRGKTIAVASLAGINFAMTLEYLAKGGLAKQDVVWQELGYPQMPLALEKGHADAVSLTEPFLAALQGRVRMLSPAQATIPGAPIGVYVARRAWLRQHPDLAARFERGYARGVRFCNDEPERARALLPRHTGLAAELVPRVAVHLFRPMLTPADLTPLVTLATRHGLLTKRLDLDALTAPARDRAR
jgi:NitT/TauT family transport system substrate-binding protein